MDGDIERKRQEEQELRKVFREMFPLAAEADLPWAACHIKAFLRDRIKQEVEEGMFHFQSRCVRVLCEISPPKTHVVDMCRIVVDEATRGRSAAADLEELKPRHQELGNCLREIAGAVGCDPKDLTLGGLVKIVRKVRELVGPSAEPA